MLSRLLAPTIVSAALIGTAAAQPDVRDHRTKEERRDARRPPPPPEPAGAGPREAPPAPREEKMDAPRPGFVWVRGRWDWKGGKWDWVNGHWERERAGKKWREGRWERKGDTWGYIEGGWDVGDAAPPGGPDGRPREAPPTPREEKMDPPRPGFVWVRGHWDWKAGKWDWVNGRWERERAGKKWRTVRWELRDGYYTRVDGDWVDQNAPEPPPGPPPGAPPPFVPDDRQPPPPGTPPPFVPDDRQPRPRREWKLERPVVSSYWPARGKEGTRVVIRGRNFPKDATVVWAGAPVRAARVTEEQIVFEVPPGAASGLIAVRAGRRRDLAVGTFEVAAAYDPVAEAKKLEEERRKQAEAAWIERQKQLAKDRAAREAAWRQREEQRAANREQRRAERAAALRAKWDRAFLADAETQDELTLHAQRVAELVRMGEVAELSSNGKLVVRIQIAQTRENERHEQRMAALKAAFQVTGGAP
ncbi:MAG TPA: IPT/TIG domain-containing protein [Kofleriaceae bacterium]|nr:IPT/TIG domain-containing protein [Kofleriaceae bacterium]